MIKVYIKKKERSKINNLKKKTTKKPQGTKQHTKPNVIRRREIKIRADINETGTRNTRDDH